MKFVTDMWNVVIYNKWLKVLIKGKGSVILYKKVNFLQYISFEGEIDISTNIFKRYIREMVNYSKVIKISYFPLFFISILLLILNATSSYMNKIIIDIIGSSNSIYPIIKICMYIILVYIFISIVNIFERYINSKVSNNLNYDIKKSFFDIIQKSTYLNNLAKESSEIYFRMSHDIGIMASYFIKLVITLPASIISVFVYLTIMLSWSFKLTAFVLAVSVLQIFISNCIKPAIKRNTEKIISNENYFVKEVGEHFRGIETVKVLGIEDIKLNSISHCIDKVKSSRIRSSFILSLLNFVTEFIGRICQVGLLLIGSVLIFNGKISIGTYIGFTSILGLFASSISNIVSLIFSFEEVKVSYNRYLEMNSKYSAYEYSGKEKFEFKMLLEFKNVSFYYNEENIVLKDVNLQLRPGKLIGIVGESGCGKSTLGKLIMRLIEPVKGEVLIDDKNINVFSNMSYKQSVSYLTQIPFIFNGSIRENICMGIDEVDEVYFDYLLKKTGLTGIINKFPDGINTKIGTDSTILSVGEEQRICIARILFKKPQIIILDEPTSSLNKELDDLVSDLFKEYAIDFNALVILITHKESTLKNADIIYQMNEINQLPL